MAAKEVAEQQAKNDSIISEDPPQLKNLPELELLGAAMPSDVPEDTLPEEDPPQLKNPPELELLGAAMPSDVPEDTSPEVTSFTESAMLEPDSPKISGGEKTDREEGALVIPAKAKEE